MFAIVDIETTGGYAANNDITEVAIVLHDGQNITGRFESLIKPLREIPYFIQVLTGITPELVREAPTLEELAPRIFELLQDRIFVAHNVNFDYSFLKYHLAEFGYDLDRPRLCTVRLTRKVFPGLPSYSLGNLCRHFGVINEQRHRAGGDALATTWILDELLRNNAAPWIRQFTRRHAREQSLPPHLPPEEIEGLPYTPGVYYFHDQKDKVIYVGKAKNLKYRVRSHFTHNGGGRQRQEFLRNIHHISYRSCGSELMAFVLENIEIRRLWPRYNYSQKRFQNNFGLYCFEDQRGYMRLAIDKKKALPEPLYTFSLLVEGQRMLRQLVRRFQLCPKMCFLQDLDQPCSGKEDHSCQGACEGKENPEAYNERVQEALSFLRRELPTFAVVDQGAEPGQRTCFLVEKGRFYGMGSIPADLEISSADSLKPHLKAYPESDYIRGLIYSFVSRKPEKKIELQSA